MYADDATHPLRSYVDLCRVLRQADVEGQDFNAHSSAEKIRAWLRYRGELRVSSVFVDRSMSR
jgi:hypothetical protein